MPLIINQGKQDTSNDDKFEVIKEKGIFGKISDVKLHDSFENTLVVEITIIDHSKYSGRKVWDNVTFDPKSEYAWKYRALRKCIGHPYMDTEKASIDIEKLLLNKKVKINLDGRMGSDGNEYQKITYVAKKSGVDEAPKAVAKEPEPFADFGTEVEAEDSVDSTSDIEQDVEW